MRLGIGNVKSIAKIVANQFAGNAALILTYESACRPG